MLAVLAALVFITTFVAVALAVLVAWFTSQRFSAESVTQASAMPLLENTSGIFKNDELSTISIWGKLLERFDFVEILRKHLAQADLAWSVGRLTALMLLSGTLSIVVLANIRWVPVWAAVLFGAGGTAAPYLWVLQRRNKRVRKFEEDFPEALDSLARALRSGHPFAAAVEIVVAEAEAPVSTELKKVSVEGNFGTSWEQALQNLCERMPLLEVYMFASAVVVQSRAGGKLNEVLLRLAETMRESISLKGEVRALAAHGRMTGMVLTVLPIAIAGIMLVVSPEYLGALIAHPYGKYLLLGAVASLLLAHIVIRRIVDIKI